MLLNQWTFLDYVFVCILLISIGFAITKGLAREIISLAALIGGFILAVFYYHALGSRLLEFCRTEEVADFVAFTAIFVGCLVFGGLLSLVINRFLKAASLKWIDRLLGGIFGLLRGWIIASILVLALVAFPLHEHGIPQSVLAPYLLAGARAAVLLVPDDLKGKFHHQYKKILEEWNRKKAAA